MRLRPSLLATGFSLFALLLPAACAKKMLPPSPDRFAPRLQAVETRSRSQVELVFDEEMASDKVWVDSFVLSGPDGARVQLRGASMGRQSDRILLWTPMQVDGLYEVRGFAEDRSGNAVRFRSRFRGSVRADTVPPRITRVEPAPGGTGLRRRVFVRVRFSEPVDTAATPRYMFVPGAYDTLFVRSWDPDWQTMSLLFPDSLDGGTVVYFLLLPGAQDLEGNHIRNHALTYFTPDSVLDAPSVRGRIAGPDNSLSTGVVLFHRQVSVDSSAAATRTIGLAAVLTDGTFATRVPPGDYLVEAVSDTDFDGLIDLRSPLVPFSVVQESLRLSMEPESVPRPVDAYRR